jgi:hypothetical protein
MVNVLTIRFTIERIPGGGYKATCTELGACLQAGTLPELEINVSDYVKAIVEEYGIDGSRLLIRRSMPPGHAKA